MDHPPLPPPPLPDSPAPLPVAHYIVESTKYGSAVVILVPAGDTVGVLNAARRVQAYLPATATLAEAIAASTPPRAEVQVRPLPALDLDLDIQL